MVITIEFSENPDKKWNDRLLKSELGNIYQTHQYGKFTEQARNWETNFLKFINSNGDIVGQVMLTKNSQFQDKKIGSFLRIMPKYNKKIYRWRYGPIIFDQNLNSEICDIFKKFLLSKKCIIRGSEHPLGSGNLLSTNDSFNYEQLGTFLIDLSIEKKILWSKLNKHSARKNVARSLERNVQIKEMKKSNLKEYHKMLHETKLKAGGFQHMSRLEKMWEQLHPLGLTGFMAYENEQPIGGIMISSFNKYMNELGVARSERDFDAKLYSQDLLKWKIIEWGIENDLRYYDLTGVNPQPKDEKEMGIYRYKKKWGGNLIKYGQLYS